MYIMLSGSQYGMRVSAARFRGLWGTLGDIAPTAPGGGVQKAYGITSTAVGTAATFAAQAGATSVLATVGPIALTVPVIGGIVVGVIAIMAALHVGEGCGEACIDAAKAEQVFEAAADDIYLIAKAGMLPSSLAVAAIQWILEQGRQSMSGMGTKQGRNGLRNMTKVINAEISVAQALPDKQTAPLDPNKIKALYLTPPIHGWYDDALASAEVLAGNAIAQLPAVANALKAGSSGSSSLMHEGQKIAQEAASNPLLTIGLLAAAGLALKMVM